MVRYFVLASVLLLSACSLAPNRNLPVLESVPETPGAFAAGVAGFRCVPAPGVVEVI